ncbi:rRNA maturation RNase YbeY [Gluconacetobacter tumulicola]|uniref:Endoribonuclease YbeY n=2 Tax=Gluconacetobacter tumulicola TaxID=1017177 RepID=A0A7W4JGB1_9PROT|nr:rRNA maturation RNase YbeY [Gluconacetobacter tumulicola]
MEPRSSKRPAETDGDVIRPPAAGMAAGPHSTMTQDDPECDVIVADARWHSAVPGLAALVRRTARAAWAGEEPAPVTIALDNDRTIRRLNARHRDRNKPTNVLTFDYPDGMPGGDIMIALETVRREAQAAGRPIRHHLMHLIVHGILHLRGHDHHQAGEARRMEMEEARILGRLSVPNPWKFRPGSPSGRMEDAQ